jgi:hypothetical protein
MENEDHRPCPPPLDLLNRCIKTYIKKKKTSQGSQGPREGQSNTFNWEPIQVVRPSLGRLFSWNLASSEMPNCSRGSCGGHGGCEQGQGKLSHP